MAQLMAKLVVILVKLLGNVDVFKPSTLGLHELARIMFDISCQSRVFLDLRISVCFVTRVLTFSIH